MPLCNCGSQRTAFGSQFSPSPCGVKLRPSGWQQEPLPAEPSHSQVPSKIVQGSAESGSSAGWSKQIHLCQRLVSHLNSPSLFLVVLPKNKLVISSSKPILSSPISLSLCWEINFKPRMTFDSILSAKVVSFQTVEINHWEPMGDRVSAGEIYGQKGQCWGNYG